MMQAPGAASGPRCPFCGAPVTIAGARYCAVCGRDMLTGAPNTGQVAPVAQPPQPAYAPPPAYPAPVAQHPQLGFAPQPQFISPAQLSSRAKVSAVRLIGLGFATLGVMLILVDAYGLAAFLFAAERGQFGRTAFFGAQSPYFLSFNVFSDWADALAIYVIASLVSYLYGAWRLVNVPWWRAMAECCVIMILLAASLPVALALEYPKFWSLALAPSMIIALFGEFVVAALIGAGFAALSATWAQIRSRSRPGSFIGRALPVGALLTVLGVVAIVWPVYEHPEGLISYELFESLIALALVIGGSIVVAVLTNRWLAQPAAPSWSPPMAAPGAGAPIGVPYMATTSPTPAPPPVMPPMTPPVTLDPNQ